MALSKARRAELEQELLATMDRLDALKVELKELQAEHRQQASLHQKKLLEIRAILSGREGDQVVMPGTETGTVKPPKKAARAAPRAEAAREAPAWTPPSRRGEIVRWAADARAKRPPTFVIEQTGLRTKKAIVAKYGENATFEKGKPCPKPDGQRKPTPSYLRGDDRKKAKKAERCTRCRCEDAETTMEGQRVCWSCAYKVQEEAEAARKAQKASASSAPAVEIPWVEAEGSQHGGQEAQIGSTTWRVLEITPTRWVLESKSQRERAWHKEGVFESLAAAEEEVRAKADMATLRKALAATSEPCGACGVAADQPSEGCTECLHGRPMEEDDLDDLVGTREEAVQRHAAGRSEVGS